MFIIEFNRNLILAWFRTNIRNATSSIFMIMKINFSLCRTLYSNCKCTGACLSCIYVKVRWKVNFPSNKARSGSSHFMRASAWNCTNSKLKWAAGYMHIFMFHTDRMSSHFFWNKSNAISWIIHVNYFTIFYFTWWIIYISSHVEWTTTRYFKR